MPNRQGKHSQKDATMSQNTLTGKQWLSLLETLGQTVHEYGHTVAMRVDGRLTELQRSKLTQMDFRNGQIEIQVDRHKAAKKRFKAQTGLALEVLAGHLDTVVVLREIDREVSENCECMKCFLVDLSALGCIELVKMLSAVTVTDE